MTTLTYKTALALLATLTLFSLSLPAAVAAPPKPLLIAPGEPNPNVPDFCLPTFGFASQTIFGFGERVTFVKFNSRAAKLGLEPGDVILSLNGHKLTYRGAWNDALTEAMYNGGFVRLKIRDVNTGNIAFRQTYVGGVNGPVQHYNVGYPVGPNTSYAVNPHVHNHSGNGSGLTVLDIVKHFTDKNNKP